VVTIDQGSMCGFGFERGKSFLLFTPETEGTLSVSLCCRSKPSESAAADFAELDRLTTSGASATSPPSNASAQPTASGPPLPVPPTAATAPSPTPSQTPTPSPAPNPPATEPGRGGCAGCGVSTSSGSGGKLIALSLIFAGVRRLRRKASTLAAGLSLEFAWDSILSPPVDANHAMAGNYYPQRPKSRAGAANERISFRTELSR
jgi:hypothetical protein